MVQRAGVLWSGRGEGDRQRNGGLSAGERDVRSATATCPISSGFALRERVRETRPRRPTSIGIREGAFVLRGRWNPIRRRGRAGSYDGRVTQQPGRTEPSGGASPASIGPQSVLTCKNCGAKNRIRPSPRGVPTCGKCDEPLPWLVDAADATFESEANAAVTVVVDLWAPWCGPCRFVSPILEELSREYAGRLKVVKVNVDENPMLARRFEAHSIPTMVVLQNGRTVDRIVGAMPKPDLTVRLSPFLIRQPAA